MLVTKAGGKYGQYDVKELLPGRSPLPQMTLVYCVLPAMNPF